jgi:hypothetical protein
MSDQPSDPATTCAPSTLILHRNLEKPLSAIEHAIGKPGYPAIHAVIGPTGVGKTTLFLTLRDRIRRRFIPKEKGEGPSCIPVVPIKADLDGNLRPIFYS